MDWNRCEIMLSWSNLNCYVDSKGCDVKLSRPIWGKMWIRTDDRRWRHDINWGDIWIGTDIIGCCLEKIKLLCGLESIWKEAFTINLKYYVD
jgi:hypothetical protein